MKCWVLWLERNKGKLYTKCEYGGNAGIIRRRWGKTNGFTIPDKAIPIDLEIKRKSIALWLVDGRTGIALGFGDAEADREETMTVKRGDKIEAVQVPIYKKKVGSIAIYPVSDPTTYVKLNILTKSSFYEAIMKKLKVGFIATLIYMCAGGGLFLLGLYIIKVIFLKESSI